MLLTKMPPTCFPLLKNIFEGSDKIGLQRVLTSQLETLQRAQPQSKKFQAKK